MFTSKAKTLKSHSGHGKSHKWVLFFFLEKKKRKEKKEGEIERRCFAANNICNQTLVN